MDQLQLYGPCPSCGRGSSHDQVTAVVVNGGQTFTSFKCGLCAHVWEFKGDIRGGKLVGVGIAIKEQMSFLDPRWYQDKTWLATLDWEDRNWELLWRLER